METTASGDNEWRQQRVETTSGDNSEWRQRVETTASEDNEWRQQRVETTSGDNSEWRQRVETTTRTHSKKPLTESLQHGVGLQDLLLSPEGCVVGNGTQVLQDELGRLRLKHIQKTKTKSENCQPERFRLSFRR